MLVTSSQPSTQRPLGLSIEELYALDRQYRRIEQQQQHLTQLQNQVHLAPSNLNRVTSRSLDYISKQSPLSALPSLEVHGHAYSYRPQPTPASLINYPRSHSIDQMRYMPSVPSTPSSALLKSAYHQRSGAAHDTMHQRYHSRHRNYLQHPSMAAGNPSPLEGRTLYGIAPMSTEYGDARNSCKLRRQHPIKRESSRRILVRPVVQRRREPSVSSSCESLDESGSPTHYRHPEQSNIYEPFVPYTPSLTLTTDAINQLNKETSNLICTTSNNDSLSDDSDVNLYEMRLVIGKTYDTSDISVQLEGPKILIHCHTIEPTDRRGNYRKHEYKTELLVPDVVDDETIVAYLTEDGQLIVEGKYHLWAWEEIKRKRRFEQATTHTSSSPTSLAKPTRNDGGPERSQTAMSLASNPPPTMSTPINNYNSNNNNNNNNNNSDSTNSYSSYVAPVNKIERLDNNRTVIHVSSPSPPPPSPQYTDTRSVSDIISRFNTGNTHASPAVWDGHYAFTNDYPPRLIYHVRLPFEAPTDAIRIQSDRHSNLLKIIVEQEERTSLANQQHSKVIIRSTSRICRLPKAHTYDFARLHVAFMKDKYIRIELPTLS